MTKTRVTSVGEHWASYMQRVMPQGAGNVQITETRRAFYAGAFGLLKSLRDEVAALDDAEGERALEELFAECVGFGMEVGRGRA